MLTICRTYGYDYLTEQVPACALLITKAQAIDLLWHMAMAHVMKGVSLSFKAIVVEFPHIRWLRSDWQHDLVGSENLTEEDDDALIEGKLIEIATIGSKPEAHVEDRQAYIAAAGVIFSCRPHVDDDEIVTPVVTREWLEEIAGCEA